MLKYNNKDRTRLLNQIERTLDKLEAAEEQNALRSAGRGDETKAGCSLRFEE